MISFQQAWGKRKEVAKSKTAISYMELQRYLDVLRCSANLNTAYMAIHCLQFTDWTCLQFVDLLLRLWSEALGLALHEALDQKQTGSEMAVFQINCGKMGNSSSDENGTVTLDIKGAQSRPDSAIYGEKYTGGKDYESGHTYIYSIDYLSGYTGSQKVRHHFIVVEVPNNEFVIYQWRVAGKDYSYFVTNRLNATKCKYIGYFSVREVCNTVARVDGKHKYERTTFDCNDFANEVARLLNGNEYGVSLWCGDCR
ncbi:uncharacterized protein LOC129598456 isoform X3 [Paramacrobiotus metropolitanus]|uniref:uncharacterized protein LOC129598456 isoform X3 n=1 Tax=Paramacrobiotus metropolitanus TaxID=2943436 RepID=UPI00244628F1|nr:uncharacterized protein LOC129598456 isoform X3 [Paramacrobiotus metropolitanus]